jgi:hypothetical protein
MIDEKSGPQSPFDQGKLRLVREFLQREFRGCRHDDYFDRAKMAQVFVIEPHRRPRYILIIPKGTFEHADFAFLCNDHLADALQHARGVPLTLTARGAVNGVIPGATGTSWSQSAENRHGC